MAKNCLLKDIHDLWETSWKMRAEDKTDITYTKGNDFKSLLMIGIDLLTVWYNKLSGDNYNIIAIEEAFSFYLPGIEIPFIGGIDLIEEDDAGTIIVTDHKTSAQSLFSR